jgi:hypothetical protein
MGHLYVIHVSCKESTDHFYATQKSTDHFLHKGQPAASSVSDSNWLGCYHIALDSYD